MYFQVQKFLTISQCEHISYKTKNKIRKAHGLFCLFSFRFCETEPLVMVALASLQFIIWVRLASSLQRSPLIQLLNAGMTPVYHYTQLQILLLS